MRQRKEFWDLCSEESDEARGHVFVFIRDLIASDPLKKWRVPHYDGYQTKSIKSRSHILKLLAGLSPDRIRVTNNQVAYRNKNSPRAKTTIPIKKLRTMPDL
jgi:hypothetical protein